MPPLPRLALLLSCILLACVGPARAATTATTAPHQWPDEGFRPLTAERIATLPAADQPAWRAWLAESDKRLTLLRAARTEKFQARPADAFPRAITATTASLPLRQSPEQFRSAEARRLADILVAWQTAAGGWVKERDYSAPPPPPAKAAIAEWDRPTFDNGTTVPEMRFLALAASAAGDMPAAKPWREAFLRGLDYIFAAQYPNGGFPQIYPLGGGYHDGITYNDGAMTNVLDLLRDIADAKPEFAFVPAEQRAEAGRRLARGLACVLASQIIVEGLRTVWCQQHDMLTLLPAAARNYEPACQCSSESVGLVRFLQSLPNPSPEVTKAIAAARVWFAKVALHEVVWNRASGLQPSPGAASIWARFYETGTDRPIFGDRDHSIHYVVTEISAERQRGYAWYGNWPAALLAAIPAPPPAATGPAPTARPNSFMTSPKSLFLLLALAVTPAPLSLAATPATTAAWSPDLGDGTYKNPVLFADYSDPDVVRVGEDFYLTASSFTSAPGLPVLHSRDLVNWTIIGHALAKNIPAARFDTAPKVGGGVWAPAIRFHAGKFYIYYPDPDEGIYVVTATNPAGPWAAPVMVKAGKGLIDPCPLWDADGKVWLVHGWANSRSGRSNLLTLLPLSPDGTKPTGDGKDIILGASFKVTTLEGPKFYQLNGWYWIFAPVGGVGGGTQAVFRSKAIDGPYEYRNVLEQGGTPTNGPHQGGLVDTPNGKEWWFIHFSDTGVYGRVAHLQPVVWRADGWPVIGNTPAGTGPGTPVLVHQKPTVGQVADLAPSSGQNLSRSLTPARSPSASVAVPATSDEFDSPTLGLQWQWAANPQPGWFSLTARPGFLRLFPQPRIAAFTAQTSLLLQKFPAPEFRVTTQLDATALAPGAQAGLVVWSAPALTLAVDKTAAGLRVSQIVSGGRGGAGVAGATAEVPGPAVTLALTITRGPGTGVKSQAVAQLSYSADGQTFTNLGSATTISQIAGAWMGAKFGLFAYAPDGTKETGPADFDWFHVTALEK